MRKTSGLFAAIACCLTLTPTPTVSFAQTRGTRVALSAADKETAAFEKRVKEYVGLREGLEDEMPKLPKDATPEQIEAHKAAFQERVRAARSGAKQGDVFTPEAARLVRANYPYPETQELLEMPPTLLLRLPQLPKQVKYRFVRGNLLLVDRENGLIIDYMTNALP